MVGRWFENGLWRFWRALLTGWNTYEFDHQEHVMPGHLGHTDEMEAPLTPDIHITSPVCLTTWGQRKN